MLATAKAEASVFEQLALEAKSHPSGVSQTPSRAFEVIGKSAGDIRLYRHRLALAIQRAIGFYWSVNNDRVSNGTSFAS